MYFLVNASPAKLLNVSTSILQVHKSHDVVGTWQCFRSHDTEGTGQCFNFIGAYCRLGNFHENFIFAKRHISDVKICD